jgi:uncharacterized repeat protein (TIGR01451 family)
VGLTATPNPVTVGSNITYTATVTNKGPMAAPAVMLTEGIAPGNQLVSSTPSQGSCSGALGLPCNLGTLASGARATVKIVCKPAASGQVSKSVGVSSAVTDLNSANNGASVVTIVNAGGAVTPPPRR